MADQFNPRATSRWALAASLAGALMIAVIGWWCVSRNVPGLMSNERIVQALETWRNPDSPVIARLWSAASGSDARSVMFDEVIVRLDAGEGEAMVDYAIDHGYDLALAELFIVMRSDFPMSIDRFEQMIANRMDFSVSSVLEQNPVRTTDSARWLRACFTAFDSGNQQSAAIRLFVDMTQHWKGREADDEVKRCLDEADAALKHVLDMNTVETESDWAVLRKRLEDLYRVTVGEAAPSAP